MSGFSKILILSVIPAQAGIQVRILFFGVHILYSLQEQYTFSALCFATARIDPEKVLRSYASSLLTRLHGDDREKAGMTIKGTLIPNEDWKPLTNVFRQLKRPNIFCKNKTKRRPRLNNQCGVVVIWPGKLAITTGGVCGSSEPDSGWGLSSEFPPVEEYW